MEIGKSLPPKIERVITGQEKIGPFRVFVDLGSGMFPIAFYGNREFKGNDFYVGVDAEKGEIERGLRYARDIGADNGNISRVDENVFFMESRAKDLPFPDNSTDEVFLGNVLGQPDVTNVDSFLKQANRILKQGGVLTILEFISPNYAESRDPDWKLDKFIEKFGFEKVEEIRSSNPKFREELLKYAKQQLINPQTGNEFIVHFRKI